MSYAQKMEAAQVNTKPTLLLNKIVLPTDGNYTISNDVVKEPTHPSIGILVEYWRQCESQGGLVMNQHIPSRSLNRIMDGLSVLEPIENSDFRVRIASSRSTGAFGRDISGKLLSEVSVDLNNWYLKIATAVLAANQPSIMTQVVKEANLVVMIYETAVFPMWAPDKAARWLLVGSFEVLTL
jgi:hypothetical protein